MHPTAAPRSPSTLTPVVALSRPYGHTRSASDATGGVRNSQLTACTTHHPTPPRPGRACGHRNTEDRRPRGAHPFPRGSGLSRYVSHFQRSLADHRHLHSLNAPTPPRAQHCCPKGKSITPFPRTQSCRTLPVGLLLASPTHRASACRPPPPPPAVLRAPPPPPSFTTASSSAPSAAACVPPPVGRGAAVRMRKGRHGAV